MEKKWLSVAGLWLALIALVFIYTDRNEYTWRYEGDELGQIVISSEEADARQTQADAAMALEQQAAQARTDANLWGTDEDSVEPFRQAQNEDGGLNLTWGRYEVTVDYDGAAKADVRVVSAGYQAFIENGEVHEEMEEENGRLLFQILSNDTSRSVEELTEELSGAAEEGYFHTGGVDRLLKQTLGGGYRLMVNRRRDGRAGAAVSFYLPLERNG